MHRLRLLAVTGWLLACLLTVGSVRATASEEKLVNINTASATELATAKGIGEAKAKAIIDYRDKNGPFKSVDDLRHVKGIGDQLLEKLRSQVTVGPAAAPADSVSAKH